jgi:hypothetical protein
MRGLVVAFSCAIHCPFMGGSVFVSTVCEGVCVCVCVCVCFVIFCLFLLKTFNTGSNGTTTVGPATITTKGTSNCC